MRPEPAGGTRAKAAFFDVDHTLLNAGKAFGCRGFAGWDGHATARHARRWFSRRHEQGGLFDERVLSALRRHAESGALIVLVSSAVPVWLEPVAEHVGADMALCSRPEIRAGRYTGALGMALTGRRKAEAVRRTATDRRLPTEACHAYGSRMADLPVLRTVGNPVVVGDRDPALSRIALRLGWPVWYSSPPPAVGGAPLSGLSGRELQVLRLLSQGRSNSAIGNQLCLSPKTVEAHVRTVYQKLGLEQHPDEHRRVMAVLTYLGARSGEGGPAAEVSESLPVRGAPSGPVPAPVRAGAPVAAA